MNTSTRSSKPYQAKAPASQYPGLCERGPLGDWDASNNSSRFRNGTLPDGGDPEARTTLVMVTLWAVVVLVLAALLIWLWRREYARARAIVREEFVLAAVAAATAAGAAAAIADADNAPVDDVAANAIPLEEV
ncbi:hypothetical protein TWF506_005426 [Arthrobotrys conoides]|uniref:Uncharacterized protein n=1 Tax=Arthrobotrys conoides TaxID=74498 RepID=A0AAN8NU38_9PEZI